MDFGLKEIGITFMVGAFTILGFELVLFYLLNIEVTGFFRDRLGLGKEKTESPSETVQNMRLAVFIGLSFGVGILAEDVSYKFVDTELPLNLPTRYDTRVQVLIGDLENPKVSPLARELARNNTFKQIENESFIAESTNTKVCKVSNGIKTQHWLLSENPQNPCQGEEKNCFVTNSILHLYYHAKNNVFNEKNYYDEMQKIQSRSDFARSIAVISFIYLLYALIIIGILIIINGFKYVNNLIKKKKQDEKKKPIVDNIMRQIKNLPEFSKLLLRKSKTFLVTLLVLLSVLAFSNWAFYNETTEFNKRAFGYFSTMQAKEKLKEKEQKKTEK